MSTHTNKGAISSKKTCSPTFRDNIVHDNNDQQLQVQAPRMVDVHLQTEAQKSPVKRPATHDKGNYNQETLNVQKNFTLVNSINNVLYQSANNALQVDEHNYYVVSSLINQLLLEPKNLRY